MTPDQKQCEERKCCIEAMLLRERCICKCHSTPPQDDHRNHTKARDKDGNCPACPQEEKVSEDKFGEVLEKVDKQVGGALRRLQVSEENSCCDKCYDVSFEKDYPAHTALEGCTKPTCSCHSPTPSGEGDLKIKNFHCSLHGYIKPVPQCPSCIPVNEREERQRKMIDANLKIIRETLDQFPAAPENDSWEPQMKKIGVILKKWIISSEIGFRGAHEEVLEVIREVDKAAYNRGKRDGREEARNHE